MRLRTAPAQLCRRLAGLAAAVALLALASPQGHAAAEPQAPRHRIAIETVEPGREGLELTALLAEDGDPIAEGLSWMVRSAGGAAVFSGDAATADVSAAPGDYRVELRYGAAHFSSLVSLPPGTRLEAAFVIPAGGLRVTPKIGGMDVPAAASRLRVFALDGDQAGRLLPVAARAGAVLPVPEGTYRVESRVSVGNVTAVTDVKVKAGRLSNVEIGHKAGLARLSFVGSPQAAVRWEVEDAEGVPIAVRSGIAANVALRPGTYLARAEVGQDQLTASFTIAAGDIRDILLGN